MVSGLVEGKNISEIGDGNKVFEDHINKQAFTVFGIMCFPRTKAKEKLRYSSCGMAQLCPVASSSSVLPCGLPPSPTVVAVVLGAKAFVWRTWPWWK